MMAVVAILDLAHWKKMLGFLGGTGGLFFFIKGPKKSNQLSKYLSQRMVTELRF